MNPKLLFGAILVISAIAVGWAAPVKPVPATVKTALTSSTSIHEEIDFKVSPQRIYDALLDSKQFGAFTGLSAEIHREPGGSFTCFEGQISGRNIELILNKRIVQAWRSNGWPEGTYSIVKFELKEQGSGTRLIMDHTGFPEGSKESLEDGWKSHYWDPLQKYVAQ
jgi:activator of HSP90 ATPase